jgi:hypothetical protein
MIEVANSTSNCLEYGAERPVGVVPGGRILGRKGVVPASDRGGVDVGDLVEGEGGQDMEAQESYVLSPGRLFEFAAGFQPLAGVLAEELFTETWGRPRPRDRYRSAGWRARRRRPPWSGRLPVQ